MKPIKAPDSAEKRRVNGHYRSRRRAFDGRTRQAKRWRALNEAFKARSGHRHDELCASLASLTVRREQLDVDLARGRDVDADLLLRLSSEIRRTAERLGLVNSDDEPKPLSPDAPSWLVGSRAEAEAAS